MRDETQKIDLSKAASILANIGVIAGIVFLAVELHQNNELMEAEARQIRTNMVIEAWRFSAEYEDLAVLREREKNGEDLDGGEIRRVDASIMAVLVMLEWTFRELSENSPEMNQVREVQSYSFANHPEFQRVWDSRKDSFDPSFAQWMDKYVANH